MKNIRKPALRTLLAATAMASTLGAFTHSAQAAEEQFIPMLAYRTGSFAPLGIPWANGKLDYLKLVNARDGGVNGVKFVFEECETAYNTDRGVECYERLKGKHGGATMFDPQSTGITYALIEKATADKIPLLTTGYGRSEAARGDIFPWTFPMLGNYWTAANIMVQHFGKVLGGMEKLKDKKVAIIYHDSPYGKEPIQALDVLSEKYGFNLIKLPVVAPGVEQKSTWLQVRKERPDFIYLQSAGIMTPTAIREARATGYPREKIYAIWWAGSEADVKDLGEAAKGYNAIALQGSAERDRVHEDVLKYVYDANNGSAESRDEVGTVSHTRAMLIQLLTVEAVRTAQEKFGKGKRMTSEQVRWGFEHLNLTEERLKELGVSKILRPVHTACNDHLGSSWARIITWNGSKFETTSDWYQADMEVVQPIIDANATQYAKEKGLTPVDCAAQ